MSRPLAESVYVAGSFYAAGVVPPEEVAALITNPKAWGDDVDQASPRPATQPVAVVFDPSAEGVGVDDVNNHLANADDDEITRVLAAEAEGKARKGILEGPYAPEPEGD